MSYKFPRYAGPCYAVWVHAGRRKTKGSGWAYWGYDSGSGGNHTSGSGFNAFAYDGNGYGQYSKTTIVVEPSESQL